MTSPSRIIIYQTLVRLQNEAPPHNIPNGSKEENGCGKMNHYTENVLRYIRQLGATHVWFTGLLAHATTTDYTAYGIPADHPAIVKGRAGSPYAVKDYYDIDPDLAEDVERRMEEFEALVERTHREGLKVVMDFIPNHVSRQYHSLRKPAGVKDLGEEDDPTQAFHPNNNFYYIPQTPLSGEVDYYAGAAQRYEEFPAKATGNDRFDAQPNRNDWYETVKLNYGVNYQDNCREYFQPIPSTWKKMRDILLFWAGKGVDAFRCDMAEMVPCAFWQWVIPQIKADRPEILFIAEIYRPHEYRNYIKQGGFDYLYDKVGMYDCLRGIICGYQSASSLTYAWQAVDDIREHMLYFLENHDEQRIASDFFAGNAQKALPALVVSACMSTNPFMLYAGQEFGERGMDTEGFSGRDGRTTIFDYWSVDTLRRWSNGGRYDGGLLTAQERELQAYYRHVLQLCRQEKTLRDGRFFDLMYVNCGSWQMNEHKQYAFLRQSGCEVLLVVCNFGESTAHIQVNIPLHAFEYFGVQPKASTTATDLLTSKKHKISFTYERPTAVDVPACGSVLLKVKLTASK